MAAPLAGRKAAEYYRAMGYTIRIDRSMCRGYGDCVSLAPEVFAHDAEDISYVLDPEGAEDETILDAARACPQDAITIIDEEGDQVWP